jgi:predicted nucleic acid-binding protein
MPYLLDSNWVIDYLGGDQAAVNFIDSLVPQGIGISVITYLELYQGIIRQPSPQQSEAQLQAFLLAQIPVFPLTLAVARRCAQLRDDLKKRGKRVSSRALDLIIAATALEHGLTLVTKNRADFQDIPGLQLY